jgi:hypothetical protein
VRAFAFALLAIQPAVVASPALAWAEHSLDGNPHCVAFRWEPGSNGEPRAAMALMVKIGDKPVRVQLDTGADFSIVYGKTADRAGWAKPADQWFRPARIEVVGQILTRRSIISCAT